MAELQKLQERKAQIEEELARTEKQIYDLEGEYLQETLKDGNILRGWDSYLGTSGASSGAIRRINRFREADRMFSMSSVTAGPQSAFVAKAQSAATAALSPSANARGAKVKNRVPSHGRKRGRDDDYGE
jgi:hypothetical protein